MTSSHSILIGQRVRLRGAEEADAHARLAHGRHSEILRMYGADNSNPAPYTLKQCLAWVERIAQDPLHWVIDLDGTCVGEARLHTVVEHDARAMYAVGLMSPGLLGRGLGTEVTQLVLDYAFGRLGLHRVGLRAIAFNKRAIRCYEKCGFVIEGRERHSARVGDEWHDDVIMGALATDHRSSRGGSSHA